MRKDALRHNFPGLLTPVHSDRVSVDLDHRRRHPKLAKTGSSTVGRGERDRVGRGGGRDGVILCSYFFVPSAGSWATHFATLQIC